MNNTNELLSLVYIDQESFGCNNQVKCPHGERTLSYAVGVNIPQPGTPPEQIFKECCYTHNIYADANSNEDFKNDYSSFYHQRQLSNETVEFFLNDLKNDDEIALNNDDYGLFFGFGKFSENINIKGYLVKWKKVLESLGEGSYTITKKVSIAGVPVEFPSLVFTLRQYSSVLADKTTRIDVVMNGLLEKSGVDFSGIGWKHSIRVPGFFGRRNPQFEEDNRISRNYEKKQISMKQTNEYKFQTNLVPDCVTNEIYDFILLANDIYMNDYNLNNHSYDFVKFGVKFSEGDEPEYGSKHRKARLNLTFNDKKVNNIKRNF